MNEIKTRKMIWYKNWKLWAMYASICGSAYLIGRYIDSIAIVGLLMYALGWSMAMLEVKNLK